ncbi:MAG: DJ-1 family glyoxalase III [Lachnospiraceae bacterium]|nr:DJ-1 family glyoxalase III [Lachnospiraceae bacterium]
MNRICVFTADGVEEVEALTVVDLLRRQKCDVDMISLGDSLQVTGSHGIVFMADKKMSETDFASYDTLVIPGGLKGTSNLKQEPNVLAEIRNFHDSGRLVAAICAGPTVLASAGILAGKNATVYPGMEDSLGGANPVTDREVVTDANVITSRGMGTAIAFGLAIISYISSEEDAKSMAGKIVFQTT